MIFTVLEGDAGAKYPLRAAIYRACNADLGSEDWTQRLIVAGFDPSVPTVWVAEGLLPYLSEATVTALLKGSSISFSPAQQVPHDGTDTAPTSALFSYEQLQRLAHPLCYICLECSVAT